MWYHFTIALYFFPLHAFEWWERNEENPDQDDLWIQGYNFKIAQSIHDPRLFSKQNYFDIAFVIDQSSEMQDTDYEPMFEGLRQYISMFRYVGWKDSEDHCSTEALTDWKGYNCFAIWRCGGGDWSQLHFKDTPKEGKDISVLLKSPKKFKDPEETIDCLTKAKTMFSESNADRRKIGPIERKNILFCKHYILL